MLRTRMTTLAGLGWGVGWTFFFFFFFFFVFFFFFTKFFFSVLKESQSIHSESFSTILEHRFTLRKSKKVCIIVFNIVVHVTFMAR